MKNALTIDHPIQTTPIVNSPYNDRGNFSSGVLPPPIGSFYVAPNLDVYEAPNGDPYGYA